jgi:hypothetical protein
MNIDTARKSVLSAFDEHCCYSNTLPFKHNDFIDGMAWVGLLCGACHKVGDEEIAHKAEVYLKTLLNVGKDARNFAPLKVKDGWKASTIDGLYYSEKPQSFAGPAGLTFAIQCGAKINNPFDILGTAKFYAEWSNIYGYILKLPWIGGLMRQHVNSVMLGCLISDKKPGKSLKWIYESNPFYAYIAKQKMDVEYPPDTRYADGEEIERNEVQPINKRKPSSWIWKQWPTKEYKIAGNPTKTYTPTAYVVAHYLQQSIGN